MRVIAGALFGDKRWWTCHENCGNNLINIFRELGVWQDFQLIKTEEIR
jgi:hypothetical protein